MCQTVSDVAQQMVDYNFGDINSWWLVIAGDDFESHDKTLIDVY